MATNRSEVTIVDLIRQRDGWRAALERDYQATAARLQAAYARTLPGLHAQLAALETRIAEAGQVTAAQLVELQEYRTLLAGIEAEMDGFARLTQAASAPLADSASAAGTQAALDLARAQVGTFGGQLEAAWARPDPLALRQLVDFVDSPALRARSARFGAAVGERLSDTLLTLVAQGYGPREIGLRLNAWLALPLGWADTQARTAQLYSYRLANHASFAANPKIVPEWVWWAELGPRTCLSCIAQHGSRHPVSETLTEHHRGRCAPIPVVVGTTWADDVQTGQAWFEGQPDRVKRQMMGPGLYGAWQQGEVDFSRLSHEYHDDVYGTMLRQATLKELDIRR